MDSVEIRDGKVNSLMMWLLAIHCFTRTSELHFSLEEFVNRWDIKVK